VSARRSTATRSLAIIAPMRARVSRHPAPAHFYQETSRD
jgi:hypothetical protein